MSLQRRRRFALRGPLARTLAGAALLAACGNPSSPASAPEHAPERPDAPLVNAQPGAWFDADGGLLVVGAGRRLRLRLSAPITACAPAFEAESPERVAERASLPFRVLSEACRHERPSILLREEGEAASPSELERSYREVSQCASRDLAATSGWIPGVVAASDPCPVALGLGWRLPRQAELLGLGVDDRKAIAGALFDTEDRAGFGSLLLYARATDGDLILVTLSPNAAEQAPRLDDEARGKPYFGAALRCVRDGAGPDGAAAAPPPLPNAAACLRALRADQASLKAARYAPTLPELQQLKAWVQLAQRQPAVLHGADGAAELARLLAAPAIEQLAKEAREERALTERYAELAESLDDPGATPAERQRRRAEFDGLRRRLTGKILQSAVSSSADRTELSALLAHLQGVLERGAAQSKTGKKPSKTRAPDHGPLLSRIRELRGDEARAP